MALITRDIHYKPSDNIFPQHILSKSIANEQFLLKLLLLLFYLFLFLFFAKHTKTNHTQ